MTSWITYDDYDAALYGEVAEDDFPRLALAAAYEIMDATQWRAAIATDDASIAALQACQSALIGMDAAAEVTGQSSSTVGSVASANNDGYSESYADASTQLAVWQSKRCNLIRKYLGAPATAWMTFAGGAYHPVGRNPR